MSDELIEKTFDEIRKEPIIIPDYVYDVHTQRGRRQGKTKEDFFIEEELALYNKQMSLFDYMVLGTRPKE